VTHAAANETEVRSISVGVSIPVNVTEEVIRAASRRVAAASPAARWALLGAFVLLAAGAVWWVRSSKAASVVERVRPVVRELAAIYGPPLAETLMRYQRGQMIFASAAVPPAATTTLAEQIARVLAFFSSPVLAEDIERKLGAPRNLRARIRLVREELRGCDAFVEVSRGRWVLGRPSGYQAAPLPLAEISDYLGRIHKDTVRVRPEPSAQPEPEPTTRRR
jgi:hypothetical protein